MRLVSTLADLCGLDMAQSLPDSAAVPHHLDGRSLSDVIIHDKPTPHTRASTGQLGAGPGLNGSFDMETGNCSENAKDTSGRPLTKNDHLFLVNLLPILRSQRILAADHPEELRELKSLREKYVQSLK
ncbi:MAG: hypothetical protein R3C01_09535 [Planctomycetaceae bacterium]